MTFTITQNGTELTPAIRQYVEEKLQGLEKFMDIRHIDAEVGLANGHHNKGKIFMCKVNVQVDGDVMQVEREADDLYKAIDKVKDHLREELSQWKKRLEDRAKGKA